MKKVAIRKLNRTLLKKEGTKQFYITGKNVLLKLFDYADISELISTQNDKNKVCLYLKREFYELENPKAIEAHITRANNEVRLTGEHLGNVFLDLKVSEVDTMTLESIEANKKIFLLDFCVYKSRRVFQKYNQSDEQEGLSNVHTDEFNNGFWAWDNRECLDLWNDTLGVEMVAFFYNKGVEKRKSIRIRKIGKFEKYMRAIKRGQEKYVYIFEEKLSGEWEIANFDEVSLLEIDKRNDKLYITNRNNDSWKYYERERV